MSIKLKYIKVDMWTRYEPINKIIIFKVYMQIYVKLLVIK